MAGSFRNGLATGMGSNNVLIDKCEGHCIMILNYYTVLETGCWEQMPNARILNRATRKVDFILVDDANLQD